MIFWYIASSTNSWFYSIIGSLSGAFLSGFVAIGIFVLGKHIEKDKERKKRIKRILEVQNLLDVQIKALKMPLAQQVKSICLFLSQLKENKEQNFKLTAVSGYTPEELLFIQKDELYMVLVHEREGDLNSKQECFFEYRKNMLFLAESKNVIKLWAHDFNEKYQKYVSQYNEHVENVMRTLDTIGMHAEAERVKKGEDKLLEETDKVLMNIQNIPDFQDIHITYKQLILPLYSICKDKSITYGDTRVNLILTDIMGALSDFNNYEYTRKSYYLLYLNLVRNIRQNSRILNKSYHSLLKYSVKK